MVVGKEAGSHPVPQEEISRILLDKALSGKKVVRLKGGDPFLFGRGGEELALLAEHGVPFRVVPGVTSAIAAPAYGGIPVTHRDFAASLHIITGHRRAGAELEIDYDALVRAGGTLVFLMGVAALDEICLGLLAAGLSGDTPAAVIENGTTPGQRKLTATVDTLPVEAAAMGLRSPAVIVVGGVCGLAEELSWFEHQPLFGRRIVVTRPRERAGTLSGRLRALGAQVLEVPCIETVPIVPCPEMETALANLESYTWLALTSPAGVDCLLAELEREGKDLRALAPVQLAALGPGTAKALRDHGLLADLVPETYDAAHLGGELGELAAGRVLILRAAQGSRELTAALDAAGLDYDDVAIYNTRYDLPRSADLRAALEQGEIDLVTFTSASTVKGFAAAVGEDFDYSRVLGACIGHQTAAEAAKYGIRTVVAR